MIRDIEEYRSPIYAQKRKFASFESEDEVYITTLQKLNRMNLSVEILRMTTAFSALEDIERNPALIKPLKEPAVKLLNKWRAKLANVPQANAAGPATVPAGPTLNK